MEVEWMETIAKHLGRIADVHERVARALERIAKSAESAMVIAVIRHHGSRLRDDGLEDALRAKVDQWARKLLESKTES